MSRPKRIRKPRTQIIAKIDAELAAQMRAECERRGVMIQFFIERAIEAALAGPTMSSLQRKLAARCGRRFAEARPQRKVPTGS